MLTPKQYELLVMLNKRLEETGVAPSYDEMKDDLGLKSKSGIHRLITGLEERGFIRRLPHRARAIEVLHLPDNMPTKKTLQPPSKTAPGRAEGLKAANENPVSFPPGATHPLPLYGKIAAGTPIEALRDNSTFVDIPPQLLGRGEYYALEVEGDSMVDAGILDGDTVIIERIDQASNNDIVVALVDNEEATLKQIVYDKGEIILIPANSAYQPKRYAPHRVQIQGKLSGLLRSY